MRYIVLSRGRVWLWIGVVALVLLAWYGLSGPPVEVPTSGVSIHRADDGPSSAVDPVEGQTVDPVVSPDATRQTGDPPAGNSEFVAQYNLERSRQRSYRTETLARIIDDPATSQVVRDEAQRKMLADLDVQTKEEELARLLTAEGFRDPVVVLNDRGLTISLYGSVLDGSTATRVGELAARMTGVSPEKIVIMERR